MLGIGMPELIVIAVIALIVIGPEKLPGLAKTIGRMFGELKKATNEFKETMEVESKMADVKKAFEGINEKEIIDRAEPLKEPDMVETPPESPADNSDEISNERIDEEITPLKEPPKDERG